MGTVVPASLSRLYREERDEEEEEEEEKKEVEKVARGGRIEEVEKIGKERVYVFRSRGKAATPVSRFFPTSVFRSVRLFLLINSLSIVLSETMKRKNKKTKKDTVTLKCQSRFD